MRFQIGSRVKVGKPIGHRLLDTTEAWVGTVVDIIPGHRDEGGVYRETMCLVRGEIEITSPTLTPNPGESWIDWRLLLPDRRGRPLPESPEQEAEREWNEIEDILQKRYPMESEENSR